jgi:uridine phosphorylase
VPVPNFPRKHELDALVHPAAALHHLARGRDRDPVPESVVLVYSRPLLREILDRHPDGQRHIRSHGLNYYDVTVPGGSVALLGGFGIGGPAAAVAMEQIVAAGAKHVISIGGAGGLHPDQLIGDIVVCDRALRDEGVSHHYLGTQDPYVRPDTELTGLLQAAVESRSGPGVAVGGTWTTDAPFRETRDEVLHYRAEGLLTVEMEAASLAAVALHRGVRFATAFAVMDSLAEDAWRPEGLGHRDAHTALHLVFDAAAEVLVGL